MIEDKIKQYVQLLKEYNETVNIFSKKSYHLLDFHIQDSLKVASLIGNNSVSVYDFGSGSGLPSIPIAIQNPQNSVVAFESKSRKSYFLEHAADILGLTNYMVKNVNVVEYGREAGESPDFITAKAFAPYEKMPTYTKYFASKGTTMILPISKIQHDVYAQLDEVKVFLKAFPEDNLYYILKPF